MSCSEATPAAKAVACATFTNPVIWEDLPDMEVIRVGNVYYMSASSFAFSPGAPVLQSHNLVDWAYVGHSVPELAFGERFSLDGHHCGSYGKGIWASTMKYRKSDGLFYWYGPIQGTEKTYIYTAKSPSDTWTCISSIDKFYYDLGLFIDDDDTPYLAYGTKTIHVAKLSPDGCREVESKPVYTSDEYLEGARMYKISGAYYIWLTRPFAGQYVLKSSSGPFGPYQSRRVIGEVLSPIPGSGFPHQGALVDTASGKWYYMAFMDGFPCGRVPVLAPVTFDDEGWPQVQVGVSRNDAWWQLEYPNVIQGKDAEPRRNSCFRNHFFGGDKLEHCWEWNHNPDNSRWNIQKDGALLMETATVTDNLFLAANTLTHRTIGPASMATFFLDVSGLQNGDRAGACIFRDKSAYIGIHKDFGVAQLVNVHDIRVSPISTPVGWMNGHPVALDWSVDTQGTVEGEAAILQDKLWLRLKVDVRSAFSHGFEKEKRLATFEYSHDGKTFTQLGRAFVLTNEAVGYVGYRFAVFNYSTMSLGGRLLVKNCDIMPLQVN